MPVRAITCNICYDVIGELHIVDTIHSNDNKFVTGVKIKAAGEP